MERCDENDVGTPGIICPMDHPPWDMYPDLTKRFTDHPDTRPDEFMASRRPDRPRLREVSGRSVLELQDEKLGRETDRHGEVPPLALTDK